MTGVVKDPLSSASESSFFDTNVYRSLIGIECCKLCSLRLCGETKSLNFRKHHEAIGRKGYTTCHEESTDTNNGLKKVASNPCVACLGMLQPPMCDKIIDKIVEAVKGEHYDNPTFNVAFTLPVSFYLRAHSLLAFLMNNFPEHVKDNLPLGVVTVGVKEAWKNVFANKLADRINKKFRTNSDLRIQVGIQYDDDHAESSCLSEMYPNKFKEQKIRSRRLRNLKGPTLSFSRKCVESVLELGDREHFAQFYPIPPPVPTHSADCSTVLFEQAPIFIGGRYNKFMRGLPQTAWLVQDQRKLETSVHELIGDKIQAVTKAEGSKLISSGREDVDVRMLGSGRPFAMELLSPRHVILSPAELKALEQQINADSEGKVAVSKLQLCSKSVLDKLKEGEEHKSKTYEAYCVAWGVEGARVAAVGAQAPLTLQQKTPVRVLHRRPIATRPKAVHWMKVSDIKSSLNDNSTYFKLSINTQAGTYIKEFIHGDFGRTKPCLGDLLGGVTADCLALDVMDVKLDWPPS